jgi:hypothetical protein
MFVELCNVLAFAVLICKKLNHSVQELVEISNNSYSRPWHTKYYLVIHV